MSQWCIAHPNYFILTLWVYGFLMWACGRLSK
jgi:hypothetical protein